MIKAKTVHNLTQLPVIADDTGLEVEALNGAPGIYSARYAGKDCNPNDNMQKVLQKLVGRNDRNAKFRTVIALIIDGKKSLFEGECEGEITKERKGEKKLSQRITANESIKNMLILLLKLKCRKHGIAEKMIATNNQIQNIASGNYKKVPALLGWRKEIFGNDAIRLKKGEISLKISRGKIVLAE